MANYPWSLEAMCVCGIVFGRHTDDKPLGIGLYPCFDSDCEAFTEKILATVDDFMRELNS